MPLFCTNATDMTIHLKSFDGDSVAIHPKSREVKVSQKFNWQIPILKGFRAVDAGPDLVDPNKIVRGRAVPEPARRPKGHHNKSRDDKLPIDSAKAYMEKVARINSKKAQSMALERQKIEERFAGKV